MLVTYARTDAETYDVAVLNLKTNVRVTLEERILLPALFADAPGGQGRLPRLPGRTLRAVRLRAGAVRPVVVLDLLAAFPARHGDAPRLDVGRRRGGGPPGRGGVLAATAEGGACRAAQLRGGDRPRRSR
jgi:hypothetical protein